MVVTGDGSLASSISKAILVEGINESMEHVFYIMNERIVTPATNFTSKILYTTGGADGGDTRQFILIDPEKIASILSNSSSAERAEIIENMKNASTAVLVEALKSPVNEVNPAGVAYYSSF